MAHLFSHKLLQETIKNVTIPEMEEKIAVLQSRVTAITTKSIYKKTESECEQAFNLDIFHKVLGYSFYPTEHYTLEAKGGNEVSGQKADATLGYFNTSDIEKNVSLVQVAVEIKDANTSLTKSQRREGNLSPIQQGFKYKPQYNNCKWVIVTNFVEIRLFKDTQLDYEVRNLVDLVSPDNDYQNFKLFWFLLNAKHLIAPTGMESVTEKLLSAVRIQSEQITKKFYQEYKTLRLELINDIRKSNTEVSLDMVIQKAQKVIDRIVFVHFCEDFGLLPEGKLAEVIQYTQSLVGVSVWQILIGFFEAVNSGSQKLGIPNGYNGGLFHEDKELNGLKIGDHICQKFVELGKYDFQEELSVSILGHIFEQSISDLEDLRINLLGTELATNELGESTKSNKRKKDGIFYTPEYIVDYIVKNSLGKYLEEQFESIEKKHLKNEKQMKDKVYQEKQKLIYGEYKQVLENITVLDPACGSGAFLVNVFDYLLAEHKRVGDALGMGSLFDNESTYKSILQRNIYGVDLNAESVEITKLSLWLKTAEKGKKLADLDNNIKCGNSLIDDPAVAGDKAFDWNTEFADIMNEGGFDVVVGNPPYVQLQKMKEESEKLSKLGYQVFEKTGDLYCLFYEIGVKLLKKGGYLGYITSNKWLKSHYGSSLRQFLVDNTSLKLLIDLGSGIFESATVDSNILIAVKDNVNKQNLITLDISKESNLLSFDFFDSQKTSLTNIGKDARTISDSQEQKLFERISTQGIKLKDRNIEINYGIKTGYNDAFVVDQTKYEEFIKADPKNKQLLQPLLRGRDIKRYNISYENLWLINTHNGYTNIDGQKVMPINIDNYPSIKNHLNQYLGQLKKRSDKGISEYNLRNCAYIEEFKKDKVIYPEIVSDHGFAIDTQGYYVNNKCFILYGSNIRYLSCILNSTVGKYLCHRYCVNLGKQGYEYRKIFIEQIPIKKVSLSEQQPFIEKADQMLGLNKEFQEKVDFTLRFFQSKFAIEKPSTKLQKFRELDFTGFLKELKVKKLPLDIEAELMRYFEKEKAEILALKAQIDTVDREIDDMVFDLYGLSEEERKVVLGG